MQNDDEIKDEIFLDNIQELSSYFGDENEIEMNTTLFIRLMAINCPKKCWY
jgi:hypothetical protein